MTKYFISLLVAFNLLTFPAIVFSQSEPSGVGQENALSSDDSIVFDIKDVGIVGINRMLQNCFPFLQLGYVDQGGDDDDEVESGFVLNYDWHKDWDTVDFSGDRTSGKNYAARIYRGSIFAKGSTGLSDATSPQNLSEMGFSLSFRQASFGNLIIKKSKDETDDFNRCLEIVHEDDPDYTQKFDNCIKHFHIKEQVEVNHNNQFQWVYGIDTHAKMEADEGFSEKHYVYGLELSGALNPSKGHILSYLNIPDLPFMLTRKIFGGGGTFHADLPIVRTAIQYVDAQDDEQRAAVAPDDDSFTRLFGEVAFTTLICSIEGKPIKFNAAYRYYQELKADNRIKDADLDVFDFFSASIQIPVALLTEKVSKTNMFYIRFTDGELPFDEKSNTSFEFGWSTNINLEGLMAKSSSFH